ncbi:MAG: hypothetical protein HY897_08245 [Deltaproteobacteria bacterium]|nr:hypothetical protein [Deltaproteobacteria bacterium]
MKHRLSVRAEAFLIKDTPTVSTGYYSGSSNEQIARVLTPYIANKTVVVSDYWSKDDLETDILPRLDSGQLLGNENRRVLITKDSRVLRAIADCDAWNFDLVVREKEPSGDDLAKIKRGYGEPFGYPSDYVFGTTTHDCWTTIDAPADLAEEMLCAMVTDRIVSSPTPDSTSRLRAVIGPLLADTGVLLFRRHVSHDDGDRATLLHTSGYGGFTVRDRCVNTNAVEGTNVFVSRDGGVTTSPAGTKSIYAWTGTGRIRHFLYAGWWVSFFNNGDRRWLAGP